MKLSMKNTLGDVMRHPKMQEIVKYFVGNGQDRVDQWEDIPFEQMKVNAQAESMVWGLERLTDLAEQGDFFYPLYTRQECLEDEKKKDVNIIRFPAVKAPDDEKERPYIIVCAGGAYKNVWSITEGYPVARTFNELGYDAFVLNYRTGEKGLLPKPMEDLAAAIRFIISHEEEFCVKGKHYLLCGFSAGGNLVGQWGTKANGYARYSLPAPEMIFHIYPAVTVKEFPENEEFTSFMEKMCGENYTPEKVKQYDITEQVTSDYPPGYIACCRDDDLVPWTNSKILKETFDKFHVPAVLEVYEKGGHGFGEGRGSDAFGWQRRAVAYYESFTESTCGKPADSCPLPHEKRG